MKDLVEYIVKSLVDYPEEVEIHEIDDHPETTIELTVAEADMGRIIGKGGRVINAIRSVVQVLAAKQGKRVNLEIIEH